MLFSRICHQFVERVRNLAGFVFSPSLLYLMNKIYIFSDIKFYILDLLKCWERVGRPLRPPLPTSLLYELEQKLEDNSIHDEAGENYQQVEYQNKANKSTFSSPKYQNKVNKSTFSSPKNSNVRTFSF